MDFFHFNSQFKKKFLGQNDVDDAEVHGALKNLETITPIKDDKFVAGDNMTIADFSIFNPSLFEFCHFFRFAYSPLRWLP